MKNSNGIKATINYGAKASLHNFSPGRISFLLFIISSLALVIFVRLYFLQVRGYDKYQSRAENQSSFYQELIPERGEIFLKDGAGSYPVAVNRDRQTVFAVPRDITDKEKTIASLAATLAVEEDRLRERFSNDQDLFEIVKRKISEDEVVKIKELNFPGIQLMPESYRYYPGGELAAQLVGFVGSDGETQIGRYGIEAYWEKELRGEAGSLNQERDAAGRWISIADREFKPAKNGADLVLTLNHPVQYEVEKILKETIEQHRADNGTIIVMESKTGRILALANYPSFNLNEYSKLEDMSLYLNEAISFAYESGSVFKPITMAAGIDDGKVDPDTVFVDPGSISISGFTIKNSEEKSYGQQTMTQVLEESINTGVIYVEKLLGNKKFAEYVERFGFGEKTGIELPAEIAGNTKNLTELKRDVQFYTASFGQGITVTPLQLVTAYAAIANRGMLMKPQIVEKIIYADGTSEEVAPQEVRRVISEEASKQVGGMLRSVVVNGHGKRADVPGYLVGGKTGTAQVAKSEAKGYEEGLTVGSFAGFAPVDDPEFAVLVKINNPKDVQWAESTAAPAFGKVMKFLLEYHKIKPTEEYESK